MRASGQGLKASQVWDDNPRNLVKLNCMEGVTRLAGTAGSGGDDLFDDDVTAICAFTANGQWAGITFEATCRVEGYRIYGHVANINTNLKAKLINTDEYGDDVDVVTGLESRGTADWGAYVEFSSPVVARGFKLEVTTYDADSDLFPCIELRGRKLD